MFPSPICPHTSCLPLFSPPFPSTQVLRVFLREGLGWDGSSGPLQHWWSPHPHWPGGEAGLGARFRLRGTGRQLPCSGSGRGGARDSRWGSGPLSSRCLLGHPGWRPQRNWARGVPGRGRLREWLGLQLGRAPDGPGSPLSGRSSCASQGGRPIGAAEPKDRPTTRPPFPAQTGIMTVPKEMPEKWARAGAPPSWSRKKPSWGTGNGRQQLAALPSP